MPITVPKKKRTLLPLLTLVFAFSYALMTLLIVEQGAAIQAQRNLIKILMPESRELWSLRGKAIGDKQAQGKKQIPSSQAESNQAQSNQGQSNQVQSSQIPSTQAPPQHPGRTGRVAKPQTQLPPVPASDLGDQRRALRTI